jgi:hypothetical protein
MKQDDIWHYVRVYNVMPYRFCQNLITQYENDDQWRKHFWYSHGETSQYDDKELDVRFSSASVELNPYIDQAINEYCKEVSELHRDQIKEWSAPRLNRYNQGTMMREHADLIRRHKRDGVPVLSLVGVLNDDFEGGEFMMQGSQLHLQTGDILLFPSTYVYPHEVREITQGSRWSWVVWAY